MRFLNVFESIQEIKNNCKRNVGQYSPRVVLEIIEYFEQQAEVLEEEKAMLLQQIENEIDGYELVVVPAKVDLAIQCLSVSGISAYGIVTLSDQIPLLGRNYSKAIIEELRVIRDFVISGGDLIGALANGYTVETLESKIEAAVLKFVEERSEENVGYIIADDSEEFTQRITEIVTKIIREDQAVQ